MKHRVRLQSVGGLLFLIFLVGCSPSELTLPPAPTSLPVTATFPSVPTATSEATETSQPTIQPTIQPSCQPTFFPVEFVWKITGDPNPFSRPIGVAVDMEGNIYVMDAGNSRVQKFDHNGMFLLMWGSKGAGDGQFSLSIPDEGSVAVDADGNVYVGDADNYRIEKFDSNGNFLAKWGVNGSGDGQFMEIADIAINDQNNVYVSDFRNNTIQKFDRNGKFLLSWGSPGLEVGQFTGAGSIVFDRQGNVLVAEVETGRIQKFDKTGRPLSHYYLPQVADIPIVPYAIALDSQDNMYISDNPANRIVKFDKDMQLLAVWVSKGEGIGQFMDMHTIRVDEEGNVYITDSGNNCVQKLRQPSFRH
jgi:tripartite motif-containing protein 71